MRKSLLWMVLIILLTFNMLGVNMIERTVAQADHDVAVISVKPSPIFVRLGELVNITVVVENQGTENETFDVTLYYGNTAIDMKTVSNLVAGLNTSLIFTWNTMSVGEELYASSGHRKTYAIKATASAVPGETDIEDNTLVSPYGVYVFVPHYITVIPQSTVDPNLTIGMNYTVSIYTDYNGTDIWGWQFTLTYNPLVLKGVEVTNGDLITTTKHPDAMYLAGTFNNTLGKLSLTVGFIYYETEPPPTTSGPGILANVTFTVVGLGDSNITLVEKETELQGYDETNKKVYSIIDRQWPWYGHILSGYFRNMEEVIHDVTVLTVTPSPTSVQEGEPVNVTVVVKNNGTVPETFDVDVWYDYDPLETPSYKQIGTETVSKLAASANKTLTFTWDTTDVKAGNHTITAIVTKLPGETDTVDNTLQSDKIVTVYVRAIYIRADGSVDPPTAPISSVDNVTYAFTGNIYGFSVLVERSNIILDGNGYTLQGSGSGYGFNLTNINNVTIRNMEIKAFYKGVWLLDSSNNIIHHNIIANNHNGVWLWNSSHNSISGNNITNNTFGIRTEISSNNSIHHNNIANNSGWGILGKASSDNIISENNITENSFGIEISGLNNIISGNNITENDGSGITISGSNNRVSGNNIRENGFGEVTMLPSGIVLLQASNNIVLENSVTNNERGISLYDSSSNNIYHNDFIDNLRQVYDALWEFPWVSPSMNAWDDGYPSGGNYWSDYNGEDNYGGPNQDQPGSDGIGDTPYTIDANNRDRYPLTNPWSPPVVPVITATVDVNPNFLNLKSKGKWITVHIELPEGHNVGDVDISTILVDGIALAEWSEAEGNILMVKFDRQTVIEHIRNDLEITDGEVTLTITGNLYNGITFKGSHTVRAISKST